ncbi:PREDICTED: acanthoscurrin-2-like [Ipomoea nil]|uniref:acanthoscurrin-2-like n=1 Tax=Ipomoea nil TaxID=35883 RepID=UPI000901480F|nr:PREDICTED: acanthoscurrin-2-like [Ipomoea nil]
MADDVVMDGEINQRNATLAEMEELRERELPNGVDLRRTKEVRQDVRRDASWRQEGRDYGANERQEVGGERGSSLRRGGGVLAGGLGGVHGGGVGSLDGDGVGSMGGGGNRGSIEERGSNMRRGGGVLAGGLGGVHGGGVGSLDGDGVGSVGGGGNRGSMDRHGRGMGELHSIKG